MMSADNNLKQYCVKVLYYLSKIVNDDNGQISMNEISKDEYEKMMTMKDILLKHAENANLHIDSYLDKINKKIAKMKHINKINLIKEFYGSKKDAIQNIIKMIDFSKTKTQKSRKIASTQTLRNREGGSPSQNLPIATMVYDAMPIVNAISVEVVRTCELCDEELNAFVGEEDDETGESMDPYVLHSFGGVNHTFHLSCLIRRHGYNHNGCVQCASCNEWCAFPNDLGILCDQTGNVINNERLGNNGILAMSSVMLLLNVSLYILQKFSSGNR